MIDAALAEPLEAHEPPEVRGADRADVALLVASRDDGALVHARFNELPRFLRAGDLLVVNNSATIPAALPARLDGERRAAAPVHAGGPGDGAGDSDWLVELRTTNLLPFRVPAAGTRRRAAGRSRGEAGCALPREPAALLRAALARRAAGGLPSPPRRADPVRALAGTLADRGVPDRLRGRTRERRDAQRGAAIHRRAGGRARRPRRAVRPRDAARGRLLARAGREPVSGALPGAAGNRAARERRARVGRQGDRRRHHGGPRARDGRSPGRNAQRGERPHRPRRHAGAGPARDRRPDHRLARAALVAPPAARGGRPGPELLRRSYEAAAAPMATASTSSATATSSCRSLRS